MAFYTRNFLLSLHKSWKSISSSFGLPPLSSHAWQTMKSLGILAPRRGRRRGGHLKQRSNLGIKATVNSERGNFGSFHSEKGVNYSDLLNIQTQNSFQTNDARPNPNIHNTTLNSRPTASNENKSQLRGKDLPGFWLINSRSLFPKIDELRLRLSTKSTDFVAITETWLNSSIDDNLISINDFIVYRKDRSHCRGGGVGAFVSSCIPSKRRSDLESDRFECLWVWLRPHRLPRPLTGLLCCVVYNPPDTPAQDQDDLRKYIIETVDSVRVNHPHCGVVILGDFNLLDIKDILSHHNLKQVVVSETRFARRLKYKSKSSMPTKYSTSNIVTLENGGTT